MKHCPFSTSLRHHSEILHPYKICSTCLVVTALQFVLHIAAIEDLCWLGHHSPKKTSVLIVLSTIDCPITKRSLRSFVTGFVFFTHFCDCSVKTELICRNDYAKHSLNCFPSGCKVNRQFSMSFASELTSGQWSCLH